MNRTIYLPQEKSNFKRFAFYSSLQTYHNVSSQDPNYTSEEAYIMARNYILSNLTKTIKGNGSELSAYQQALNLLKAMADNELAKERGQSLAQMALAWVYSKEGITSVLIGASKPKQILENIKMLENATFTAEELEMIDKIAE